MKKTTILKYLCYFSFGLIGFIFSMRTSIFSYIQQDYLDGYGHMASLILISGIVMQISTYASGRLIKLYGHVAMLKVGLLAFSIPTVAMITANSVFLFDALYTLFMFGYGIAILVLNLYVCVLEPKRKGSVLLILHLFFAIGALIGPKLISELVESGLRWQTIFAMSAIPLIFVFLILLKSGKSEVHTITEENITNENTTTYTIKDPIVWLFTLLFLCGQVWEYGVGTWFVIFARKTSGIAGGEAAFYLTVFYGMFPLVRIVFSRIIDRLDYFKLMMFAFIYCFVLIGLGLFTNQLIFYSLTGIGVALMYPTMMAMMQKVFGENASSTIGLISMLGGFIQYIAIWGIGLIGDTFGIKAGFGSQILYMLLGAWVVRRIIISIRSQSKREVIYV